MKFDSFNQNTVPKDIRSMFFPLHRIRFVKWCSGMCDCSVLPKMENDRLQIFVQHRTFSNRARLRYLISTTTTTTITCVTGAEDSVLSISLKTYRDHPTYTKRSFFKNCSDVLSKITNNKNTPTKRSFRYTASR